jgi:hypothetical protein
MIKYLFYNTICKESEKNRIGGSAFLPNEISWPNDVKSKPMLFLMTLSSDFLHKHTGCIIPNDNCVSVFVPYREGGIECAISMARSIDAAKVIVHKISQTTRQGFYKPLFPPRKIRLEIHCDIEDEDEFSEDIEEKVGGVPTWLQDRIDYKNYQFLLQFIAGEFNEFWPNHQELFMDGVCYLFLKKGFENLKNQAGMFRIQY